MANKDYVIETLRKQIEGFKTEATTEQVGKVIEVGDGVARISGLSDLMASEMVLFETRTNADGTRTNAETYGVALNLEEDRVGATWAGVDILKTKEGKLYVLEINASPGTEGIEKSSGVKVTEKVIKFITNKDNWLKTPTECGYIETVNIESMGDMKAKMDTGNGSYCVIHSDKWEIKGNYVTWTNNGNTYEHKLDGMKRVRTMGQMEERPSILLNVTFNGDTYKDVKFTISNREQMSTPILLNRTFIRQANLVINPAKKYALSLSVKEKSKEPTNEEIKSRIRGWFE
jgi:hypothetical protein